MSSFKKSCENGDLEMAKRHYNTDICKDTIDNCFRLACIDNYFELAKWLFSLGADHNHCNDWTFRRSCGYSNFEIIKWLFSLGVDHNSEEDDAFISACIRGEIKIAQWLFSLGVNHHSDKDYAFYKSYEKGQLEVVQWLFFLDDLHHNYYENTHLDWMIFSDNNNNIPKKLLNKVLQVNVFESTQISLIDMYTKLIIS